MIWSQIADWCVPASALLWGELTATDPRPNVYIGAGGRGTAYVAGQQWPIQAGNIPGSTVGGESWTLTLRGDDWDA